MAGWSCGNGCGCDEKLGVLAETLSDQERIFERYELQALEDCIYCALCCLEKHSPDPVARMWAAAQLIDPFWLKQKSREITME